MHTHTNGVVYVVKVNTGNGAWLVRWPSGAPRRFMTHATAMQCARRWPVSSGTACVVPFTPAVAR